MKKKSLLLLTFLLVGCLLLPCACIRQPDKTEDFLIEIDRHYLSVRDLTAVSDLIVRGEVLAAESVAAMAGPVNRIRLQTEHVHKGEAQAGSQLQIIEAGGITTQQGSDKTEYRPNGIPVMKSGEKYLLFLTVLEDSSDGTVYEPVGIYQGKFLVKGNRVWQMATENDRLAGAAIQSVQVLAAEITAALISEKVPQPGP